MTQFQFIYCFVLYDSNSVHNIVGYSGYWKAQPLTCDSIPTHWCHACSPPQWIQVEAGLSRWWRTRQSGHLYSAKWMKNMSIRTSLLCNADEGHVNQDIIALQSWWMTHQSGHLYSAKLMKDTSIWTSLLCKVQSLQTKGVNQHSKDVIWADYSNSSGMQTTVKYRNCTQGT